MCDHGRLNYGKSDDLPGRIGFARDFPKVPTLKIIAAVGGITSLVACFPALVMKLLDFVALYGLLLMPMGAVIFADFYFSKKLGFRSEGALNSKLDFSWPSLLSWVLTLVFCLGLNLLYGVEIFFLGLPGWFCSRSHIRDCSQSKVSDL